MSIQCPPILVPPLAPHPHLPLTPPQLNLVFCLCHQHGPTGWSALIFRETRLALLLAPSRMSHRLLSQPWHNQSSPYPLLCHLLSPSLPCRHPYPRPRHHPPLSCLMWRSSMLNWKRSLNNWKRHHSNLISARTVLCVRVLRVQGSESLSRFSRI
jgi:hypothetical protein